MIRRFFGRVRRRDGQALILMAMLFPLVLVFLAFAVDAGHAFVDQRHLQNAADAAALAAAQQVPTCATPACLSNQVTLYSQTYNDAPNAGLQVCGTNHETNCYQYPYQGAGCPVGGCTDQVLVKLSSCTPTFFGGVIGVNSICLSVSSVAQVGTSPITQEIPHDGTTVDPHTDYFTTTGITVNHGTTTPFTNTTSTVFPGTTVGSTVLTTITNTTTTGSLNQALFAYTRDGTDACSASAGIVVSGNGNGNISGAVSNGDVTNTGNTSINVAQYLDTNGPPPRHCTTSGLQTWRLTRRPSRGR